MNQLFGVQSGLADFMINTHQINNASDPRDYVTIVSKFGMAFDQVFEGSRHREELGIVPPLFVVRHVLKEMSDFTAPDPAEQTLHTHFASEIAEIKGFDSSKARRTACRPGAIDPRHGLAEVARIQAAMRRICRDQLV